MRHLAQVLFVGGVGVLLLGLGGALDAANTVHQNFFCMPMLAPGTCASIGSSYCQAVAQQGTACANIGDCASCNTTTALPSKVCHRKEGSTCTDDNSAFINCGGVPLLAGRCGVTQGVCICANQAQDGNCPANLPAYICR